MVNKDSTLIVIHFGNGDKNYKTNIKPITKEFNNMQFKNLFYDTLYVSDRGTFPGVKDVITIEPEVLFTVKTNIENKKEYLEGTIDLFKDDKVVITCREWIYYDKYTTFRENDLNILENTLYGLMLIKISFLGFQEIKNNPNFKLKRQLE
tara:strand:+ start:144 stop:593 length:450 start_codon:yes stop_codon:yes gene_type:complete